MTHYELFFFFVAGFKPKNLIRLGLVNEGTAYRAHRNYRKAQKKAKGLMASFKLPSIKEKNKLHNLG